MWTCPTCTREFKRTGQQHSCKSVPIEQHFENKSVAKELFDNLVQTIEQKIGSCKIISIPCCIHVFGQYDFLAVLPKKDHLEIRFAFDSNVTPSHKHAVPLSAKLTKNCVNLYTKKDINPKLIQWLQRSYHLKS